MKHNTENFDNKGISRKLHEIIHEVLFECCINIKSKGYTYIRDAILLIIELDRLDLCLNKEVYPRISDKRNAGGISVVEHNIRNAIRSAYHSCSRYRRCDSHLMSRFAAKPSNKEFLLHITLEVERRMAG